MLGHLSVCVCPLMPKPDPGCGLCVGGCRLACTDLEAGYWGCGVAVGGGLLAGEDGGQAPREMRGHRSSAQESVPAGGSPSPPAQPPLAALHWDP